ncbi:MAG: hypothetical protein PHO37_10065 [Kiritimatiellae bacterium]|nr:hypothetical protein [Kiritimatiellia bacterium]
MDHTQIAIELRQIAAEAESIGPYLEGNLLKGKKAKYLCKDGTVSEYLTSPVLQYRVGPNERKSKRIPFGKVDVVERLLEAGVRHKKLMNQHLKLSSIIALDLKKKLQ